AEGIDATLATLDGRVVSSSAARRIANWCYLTRVVCAQQYELIWGEESLIADFFLPEIQLCIDYWPADSKADALAKQLDKQFLYKKYKVNFLELRAEDLPQLDDILAKVLMRSGLAVY